MPSASVQFYGRRSRSSRSFDHFTSSPSSDSNPNSYSRDLRCRRHHHRLRGLSFNDPHLRHRHACVDDADHFRPPPHSPHPSFLSPIQENELQQRQCDGESSSLDIDNRETVGDLSRRFSRNNRLPGPVLLAKERLLQRLRSVSISAARPNRETSPSFHCNDFWVVDADWETNGFREPTTVNAILAEPHQEPTSEESKKKPIGLSKETLSQLHHEIFIEHQNPNTVSMSKSSNECSICLENFVEDNELVSLPCGHRFHTSCLYPWLQTCGDCPYCRSCITFAS